MKYMPLDLSMMKPEPFPCPLGMRSDLYSNRQPPEEEGWRGRIHSVFRGAQALVHQCREKMEGEKMLQTIFSIAGACAFGLLAVGVFWLAVEMDNSDLQAAKASCAERQ